MEVYKYTRGGLSKTWMYVLMVCLALFAHVNVCQEDGDATSELVSTSLPDTDTTGDSDHEEVTVSTEQDDNSDGEFLLLVNARSNKIVRYDMSGDQEFHDIELEIPNERRLHAPRGIDYDPLRKQLYIVDPEGSKIYRSNLNGSHVEELLDLHYLSETEGITVDPAAGLYFYTDTGHDRVIVGNIDNPETMIIHDGAYHPRAVRADVVNRYVYWTDHGRTGVYRSRYDGGDLTTIAATPGAVYAGLTIDQTEGKIYWVDQSSSKIMSRNLTSTADSDEGTEVLTISDDGTLYGVASTEQYLYYSVLDQGLYRYNKNGGGPAEQVGPEMRQIYELVYYNKDRTATSPPSPCGSHPCSHLCFPLPYPTEGSTEAASPTGDPEDDDSDDDSPRNEYVCGCPDHRRLMDDGSSCTRHVTHNGPELMWLEFDEHYVGYIRGAVGTPDDFLTTGPIHSWSVRSQAWHFTAGDIDYANSRLILYDRFDKLIVYLTLNGTKTIRTLYNGMSTEVYGLAVDWRAQNVYWTDQLYNWIMVATLPQDDNHEPHSRILLRGLDQPHGIAVYPEKGLLFWSDWGSEQKIECSLLDGTNRTTFIDTNLHDPMGLTIDYKTDTLYWVNIHRVEAIRLDGTGRRYIGKTHFNTYQDVAVFGSYVMTTDLGGTTPLATRAVWFYHVNSTNDKGMRLQLERKPYSIMMYDESRQPQPSGRPRPCLEAACEHLCVSMPDNTAKCVCADDYEMSENGTCTQHHLAHQPRFIYSLSSATCEMQVKTASSRYTVDQAECYMETGRQFYRSLAYDYNGGFLYYTDYYSPASNLTVIRRIYITDVKEESSDDAAELLVVAHGNVNGIAFDWTSYLLYWCEEDNKEIWVSSALGKYKRMLLSTTNMPTAVTVDPTNRKLYWIETNHASGAARIKMAEMNGENVQIVVGAAELHTPTGLAVDFRNQRLMWADKGESQMHKFKYHDLADLDRTRVYSLPYHHTYEPYDVDVMEDIIVFTDFQRSRNHTSIRLLDPEQDRDINSQITGHTGDVAHELIAYDRQVRTFGSTEGDCVFNNCTQLCLPSNTGPHTCACAQYMTLNDTDGVSCHPESSITGERFALLTNAYSNMVYQVGLDEDGSFTDEVGVIALQLSHSAHLIEYNSRNHHLLWLDQEEQVVKSSSMMASSEAQQRYHVLETTRGKVIHDMQYEEHSRLIYATSTSSILVIDEQGRMYKTLHLTDHHPHHLLLHSTSGTLYFSSNTTINSMKMNGEGEPTVVVREETQVTSMSFDDTGDNLYWSTAQEHSIRYKLRTADVTTDSSDVITAQSDVVALSVVGDIVHYTEEKDLTLKHVHKTGSDISRATIHQRHVYGHIRSHYRPYNYTDESHPCYKNGECGVFCLPSSEDTKTCDCPDYEPNCNNDNTHCSSSDWETAQLANTTDDLFVTSTVAPGDILCPSTDVVNPAIGELWCLHNATWSYPDQQLCINITTNCNAWVVKYDMYLVNCTVPGVTRGTVCMVSCTAGSADEALPADTTYTCNEHAKWNLTGPELHCAEVVETPDHATTTETPAHAATAETPDHAATAETPDHAATTKMPDHAATTETPDHAASTETSNIEIVTQPAGESEDQSTPSQPENTTEYDEDEEASASSEPLKTTESPPPPQTPAPTSPTTSKNTPATSEATHTSPTPAPTPPTSISPVSPEPEPVPTPPSETGNPENQVKKKDSKHEKSLLIGMVLLAGVIVITVVVIIYIAYRRRQAPQGRRYSGAQYIHDARSYNQENGHVSPAYDPTSIDKQDDGVLTFENPGYCTLSESTENTTGAGTGNSTGNSTGNGTGNGTGTVTVATANPHSITDDPLGITGSSEPPAQKGSFENPLYRTNNSDSLDDDDGGSDHTPAVRLVLA